MFARALFLSAVAGLSLCLASRTPTRQSPAVRPPTLRVGYEPDNDPIETCNQTCRAAYGRCATVNPACGRPQIVRNIDGGRLAITDDGRICSERCLRALGACSHICFTQIPGPLNSVDAALVP